MATADKKKEKEKEENKEEVVAVVVVVVGVAKITYTFCPPPSLPAKNTHFSRRLVAIISVLKRAETQFISLLRSILMEPK